MSGAWLLRRAGAAGLAGLLALTLGEVPSAGAQTAAASGTDRVVGIEHRVVRIVRRVASMNGDISTEETPEQVEVTLAADVLFEFDRADLTAAAGARVGEVARQVGEATGAVAIVGYTDSVGAPSYNADLSQRRANAVRDALQPLAPAVRFTVDGRGAADPVAPNTNPDGSDDPVGRARNRRVTITFAREG